MIRDSIALPAAALGVLLACPFSRAADRPAGASPSTNAVAPAGIVLLDQGTVLRFHEVLKPPVIQTGQGLKTVLVARSKWLNASTSEPPDDWAKPDFDDSLWRTGHSETASPYLARLCARGKFIVTDPAKVKALSVSACYAGGAVLYLNGQEIARGELPPGPLGPDVLANEYPAEAYAGEDGKEMRAPQRWERPTGEWARRLALRRRQLSEIAVPLKLLRKGTNVLAVDVLRAPYDKIVQTWADPKLSRYGMEVLLNWGTCDLFSVQARGGGEGLAAPAARRAGLGLWVPNVLAPDYSLDFMDGEPVRPVRIVAARNGAFSGKVVVGSSQPLRELAAALGPPAQAGLTPVPPDWVRIRYAMPTDALRDPVTGGLRFDLLETSAPPAISPREPLNFPAASKTDRQAAMAVVPVWITVSVPAKARPGLYAATVTVSAADMPAVSAPLTVKVADFVLPDPKDYATFVDLPQSPDTLAREYNVPPWSDRHMALVEQSLAYMAQVGCRVVYIPLICDTNMGNAQSMVRWIDKGGGRYEYDFAPMDKYLDAVQKTIGRPKFVCFCVWDCFLEGGRFAGDIIYEPEATKEERTAYKGKGPEVTTLDASGACGRLLLPEYSDPASRKPWEGVLTGIMERMRKRGLDKSVVLGLATDAVPTDKVVARFKEFWPGAGWICYSHGQAAAHLARLAPVVLHGDVWSAVFPSDPAQARQYGWKSPDPRVLFPRDTTDWFPLTTFRLMGEMNIAGMQRGVGRIGADFWEVVKDKKGARRGRICELYPKANWRNLNIKSSLLLPGASGPAATVRFEMFREGLQECEARILVEQAILDKKLDPASAKRCQDALDERTLAVLRGVNSHCLGGAWTAYAPVECTWFICPGYAGDQWYVGSGWQERSEKLFWAACEAARAAGRQ